MSCSICLEVKADQVTLRCGHNFCQECVSNVLSTPEELGVLACPECKEWVQEQLIQKSKELPDPNSSLSRAEGSRILCTFCLRSPILAVKYCLRCDASLCDNHLLSHSKSPEHVLCDPHSSLQHQKSLTHRDSDEVKIKLRNLLNKLTTKRYETEKRVLNLVEYREKVKQKAVGVTDGVNVLFKKLRKQLKKIQNNALKETSRQEEKILQSVSDRIQKLEMETQELTSKINDTEKLCTLNDPSTAPQDEDSHDISKADNSELEEAEAGDVDEESISEVIHKGLYHMITAVKPAICTQSLTGVQLDLNTAADNIFISADLQAASWSVLSQSRPTTPQKFEYFQVLSSTVFPSGRHYWEVETGGLGSWRVGVCYPSIDRRGDKSIIGDNDKSWCVCQICDYNDVFFHAAKHNGENAALPFSLSCNRLGIHLDYEARKLSFYELGLPIRLIHSFTATFTEPLHAAIYTCGEVQQCPTWVRILD